MGKNPKKGVKKMKVRKNKKKITELEQLILECGEMNTLEIYAWMNERIKWGVTMAWLGNVLPRSGLFVKTGEDWIKGNSCNYYVAVWDSKRREAN